MDDKKNEKHQAQKSAYYDISDRSAVMTNYQKQHNWKFYEWILCCNCGRFLALDENKSNANIATLTINTLFTQCESHLS